MWHSELDGNEFRVQTCDEPAYTILHLSQNIEYGIAWQKLSATEKVKKCSDARSNFSIAWIDYKCRMHSTIHKKTPRN